MMRKEDEKIALKFIEERLSHCEGNVVEEKKVYIEYKKYCIHENYSRLFEDEFLEILGTAGVKVFMEKESNKLCLSGVKINKPFFTEISTYDITNFFEDYLCFKKDKVVSTDKAFAVFTSFYNIDKTEANLNAFIVEFLKGGYEVANLDGVLFFYDLTWKEAK